MASYDGTTMRLFTNGALTTSSEAQSGDIQYAPAATLAIGAYLEDTRVYALHGGLDDIALWNRALDVDAVAAMYAEQLNSPYFCCPTECPENTVSTGLCVGDMHVDCRLAVPCPKCSKGMLVCFSVDFLPCQRDNLLYYT